MKAGGIEHSPAGEPVEVCRMLEKVLLTPLSTRVVGHLDENGVPQRGCVAAEC